MEQEIKSIIEKNLPAQVGEMLQKRLKKAEDDAKALEAANSYIRDLTDKNTRLNAEIIGLKEKETKHATVLSAIEELKEASRNRKVFEAETKLACEVSKNVDLTNFVGMVFKSPVYKNSVSKWKSYSDEWDSDLGKNVKKVSSENIDSEVKEE